MEKVERKFAHLKSQTSELWLGVRDGDLALLGISMGVSAGTEMCLFQFCPHSGAILESLNWFLSSSCVRRCSGSIPVMSRAWDRAGATPKHSKTLLTLVLMQS